MLSVHTLTSLPMSEYPTLDQIPDNTRVRILRDGVELVNVPNNSAAFLWLARRVPYSVSHALKHEGYTCEAVEEVTA
jgi:hypothetical protein